MNWKAFFYTFVELGRTLITTGADVVRWMFEERNFGFGEFTPISVFIGGGLVLYLVAIVINFINPLK